MRENTWRVVILAWLPSFAELSLMLEVLAEFVRESHLHVTGNTLFQSYVKIVAHIHGCLINDY